MTDLFNKLDLIKLNLKLDNILTNQSLILSALSTITEEPLNAMLLHRAEAINAVMAELKEPLDG